MPCFPAVSPRRGGFLRLSAFVGLLMASISSAATPPAPDFSGAWRLDDRNSDTPDTLTASLRTEARKEQEAKEQQAPAAASSSPTPAGSNGGGRHGGGMGHGGMGGGGMGTGGAGGAGGGMGGGHGRHGGGDQAGNKAPTSDKDPIATATYPMPPLLKVDSVLLVQQDPKSFQIHLNDGSQLTGKLDSQSRQSLNGNAMVRGHVDAGRLMLSVEYADGSRLDQTWQLSADGQQMTVTGDWKVPTLQQPVTFKRTYVGLH
jgi:hypothetical protein